jgi:hypothetical protein
MTDSAWPAVAADLRSALARNGRPAADIDDTLAALSPVALAVERRGVRLDADLGWALLAVEVDRRRRRRGASVRV